MWFRLQAAIIKELTCYLRDPASRRFMIFAPVFQTLIFAFAASLDVQNIDIAIYDQDAGRWSQEVVARVDGAWFTDELIPVYSQQQMDELILQRRVIVGLTMAADFSRKIEAGEPAQVQVIVDGRRANAGQISVSYLRQIIALVASETPAQGEIGVALPAMQVRHWFNSNLNFRSFMVINLTATMAMMMCLVVTSLSLAREREMGTFDQLLVSPLTPLEIILSKIFPGMMEGIVSSLLIMLLAVYVFAAPFTGSLLLLLVGLSVFILSVVGVGLLISAFSQNQQQAVLGTFFTTMPFIITSGFVTPVANMPAWLQVATVINPLKHYLLVVQGCTFKAQSTAQVMENVWPLVVIAVVTFSLATIVVRRKLA
jgi:ABC-2 type transport system permease protein